MCSGGRTHAKIAWKHSGPVFATVAWYIWVSKKNGSFDPEEIRSLKEQPLMQKTQISEKGLRPLFLCTSLWIDSVKSCLSIGCIYTRFSLGFRCPQFWCPLETKKCPSLWWHKHFKSQIRFSTSRCCDTPFSCCNNSMPSPHPLNWPNFNRKRGNPRSSKAGSRTTLQHLRLPLCTETWL